MLQAAAGQRGTSSSRVIHSNFFLDNNLLLAVVLSVSLITWLVSYFYLSNTVRPKTMLQIMDKNSDTVDWIRSSSLDIEKIMASNKKSCKQFFAHCCLGQCRQEKFKIGEIGSI